MRHIFLTKRKRDKGVSSGFSRCLSPTGWSRSSYDHDMLVCFETLPEPAAVGAVWGHGKQCPGEVFVQALWLWINPEVIVVGCILLGSFCKT